MNNFLWGVATSSFQSEGELDILGRGPSIWDDCEVRLHDHSSLANGPKGLLHIDEDIASMVKLGVKAYRFSLSWTRILPQGIGPVNEKGLELYRTIIKKLLAVGIEPWVTLFHWDYPLALEQKGGWRNDDSPLWMEEYAQVVGQAFKGLVKHYIVINEPQCVVELGMHKGWKAPWQQLSFEDCLHAAHNLMKGGALGAKALKETSLPSTQIGLAETYSPYFPLDPKSEEDIKAAREATFAYHESLFCLGWWTDASYLGTYPDNWLKALPFKFNLNPKECYFPYDFVGLNIYNGTAVHVEKGVSETVPYKGETNSMGWQLTPECIYYGAKWMKERYHKPIYLTEDGICLDDVKINGKIHDAKRIKFLNDYLKEMKHAIKDGIDIKGYFYWSLFDTLEWEEGYKPRFGLLYSDYTQNGQRYEKDSFAYYKAIVESNAKCLK